MNDISILQDMGYTVHVATNLNENDYSVDSSFFKSQNIIPHHIGFQRSPFNVSNFKAIKQIQNIIGKYQIDLVHCHTPVGGVIGRLASKKYQKKGCKVIYTVHGLQFYKGAPKIDWLIYYPVEKNLSRYTDAIITINHEDHDLVRQKFHSKRVYYVPGVGVDLKKFGTIQFEHSNKRKLLGLQNNDIMLLAVGELIARKNHQAIIHALSRVNKENLFCYIAGNGPLMENLQNLMASLNLQKRVILLGQRQDIGELLACTDIFVHTAKREGLSVALMEAMASGLPVVCSKIRGNTDLIDDGQGGYLCDVNDANAYAQALTRLAEDMELRRKMGEYNQKKIQNFSLDVVDKKMRSFYQEVIQDRNK